MNKSFYRKVGFGLAVNDDMPNDPLKWAISQLEKVPNLNWKGPIYSLKEMMNLHGKYNYTDRRVLRKKHKNSRKDYKDAKQKLDDLSKESEEGNDSKCKLKFVV